MGVFCTILEIVLSLKFFQNLKNYQKDTLKMSVVFLLLLILFLIVLLLLLILLLILHSPTKKSQMTVRDFLKVLQLFITEVFRSIKYFCDQFYYIYCLDILCFGSLSPPLKKKKLSTWQYLIISFEVSWTKTHYYFCL